MILVTDFCQPVVVLDAVHCFPAQRSLWGNKLGLQLGLQPGEGTRESHNILIEKRIKTDKIGLIKLLGLNPTANNAKVTHRKRQLISDQDISN